MPGDKNPVAKVARYKESAPEIRFLTLAQIDEQLTRSQTVHSCKQWSRCLSMPELRREELLWLTHDDID